MSEELAKTVKYLIARGKGDQKRLEGILQTINKGSPVYMSDYRYVYNLTSEEDAHGKEPQVEKKKSEEQKKMPDPLKQLRIRLAEGQITIDEFKRLKQALNEI